MKSPYFLLIAVTCASILVAKPAITIGDQVFVLAFEEKSRDGAIREFLPPGETLKSWKHMVSIREFPNLNDPKQYIINFAQQYRAKNPSAKFMITEDKANGDWLIDFMAASPEPKSRFIEWNVFRARKTPKGIIVFQHAARYPYKDSVSEIISLIPKHGSQMSQRVYAAEFEVKEEPDL